MKDWWPALAAFVWLSFVQAIAGAPAAFFSGVSALLVCILALCEAGAKKRTRSPDE